MKRLRAFSVRALVVTAVGFCFGLTGAVGEAVAQSDTMKDPMKKDDKMMQDKMMQKDEMKKDDNTMKKGEMKDDKMKKDDKAMEKKQ